LAGRTQLGRYFESDPTAPTTSNSRTPLAQLAIMADTSRNPEDVVTDYDLLPKLVTHLDRHLIFPLLQFVEGDEETPASARAQFELLKKTNMTDFVAKLYCAMEDVDEPPREYATKRQEVLDRLEKYSNDSKKITDLLEREDVVTGLRSDKLANLEFLKKEHDVSLNVRGV
jgi:translation initiation factor 3 subunit E